MSAPVLIFWVGWACWLAATLVVCRDFLRGYSTDETDLAFRCGAWVGLNLYILAALLVMPGIHA